MEWAITHIPDDNIIIVVNSGVATLKEVMKMNLELASFSRKKQCMKHLLDFRNVIDKMTVLDIHNLPKELMDIGCKLNVKVALIRSSDPLALHNFSFFEDRCKNMSMTNNRVFSNYDEAFNWLKS